MRMDQFLVAFSVDPSQARLEYSGVPLGLLQVALYL